MSKEEWDSKVSRFLQIFDLSDRNSLRQSLDPFYFNYNPISDKNSNDVITCSNSQKASADLFFSKFKPGTDKCPDNYGDLEERIHKLALNELHGGDDCNSPVYYPQAGFTVNHNVKTNFDDGFNSIMSILGLGRKDKDEQNTSFYTAFSNKEEESIDYKPILIGCLASSIIAYGIFKGGTYWKYIRILCLGSIIYSIASADWEFAEVIYGIVARMPASKNENDVEMEVFESQSINFDAETLAPSFAVLLSMMAGYRAKSCIYNALLNATKVSDVQISNVSGVILSVTSSLREFLENLSLHEFAEYFDLEVVSNEEVKCFVENVESFQASFNSGNPESAMYCKEIYEGLIAEGKKLFSILDKKSFDYKMVNIGLNKLSSISQKIADIKYVLNGERVEPVGIMIKGKPGIKKGVLASRLAKVLAKATLPVQWQKAYQKDPKDFFYTVPSDQYWEGYTNKAWITMFDDIFQKRESVGAEDADSMKVIDMINSAPYCLKMANINSKNGIFFRSAFVIATSNLSNYDSLYAITDPRAVKRRFHIEVDVDVNPKYCDIKGDPIDSLLPERKGVTDIPSDYWNISALIKTGSEEIKKPNISIKEFIKLVIDRHYKHIENFDVNRDSEQRLVDEMAFELGFSDCPDLLVSQGVSEVEDVFDTLDWDERALLEFEYLAALRIIRRVDYDRGGYIPTMRALSNNPNIKLDTRSLLNPGLCRNYLIGLLGTYNNAKLDPFTEEYVGCSYPTINKLYSKFRDSVFKAFSFIKKYWMFIAAGLALVIFAAPRLLNIFDTIFYDSQSVDRRTMGLRTTKSKKLVSLSEKASKIRVSPQGISVNDLDLSKLPTFNSFDFGARDNKTDVISKIFNKYFYIIYMVHKSHKQDLPLIRLGHCMNLCGNIFMMPMHFIFLLDSYMKKPSYEGMVIILTTTSGTSRMMVEADEFIKSFKTTESAANRDLCLLKLECAQRMSKGVISNVITRADQDKLNSTTSFDALLLGSSRGDTSTPSVMIKSHYVNAAMNKGSINVDSDWHEDGGLYNLFDTYMYKSNSVKGDCGSLLFATEANFENRILCGIHVAGGKSYGFSTSFDKESLVKLVDECFPEVDYFKKEQKPDWLMPSEIVPQGNKFPLFMIRSDKVPMEITKSQIKKSALHSKLPGKYSEVISLPAKLKPFHDQYNGYVNPKELAFSKYNKKSVYVPYDLVQGAIQSYESLIMNSDTSKRSSRRFIPLREALHSFDNVNSISSSTSSGFPMSMVKNDDYKKIYYGALFLGQEDVAEEAFQRIALLVEEAINCYKNNERPFFAYKQCLKDETRPREKVLLGKTRLFSASPFVMLCLFRMYFGSFISEFISMNHKVGSAVGVNPYSEEWDIIARKLLSFSEYEEQEIVAAGDQGQFDTRQWPIVHNSILDMINRWYGRNNPDNIIRSQLFMEITNSRHVYGDHIYEWNTGLPSGNPLTAILNTIYNNLAFRMCWILSGLDIDLFNTNCYVIILGDDNVFSVSEPYRKVFNEMTLPDLMAMIGNEYTTELKGEAVTPFRKITQVEFLKRGFRLDKELNRWVAPLREEAICDMLNWTKKGKDGDQITLDNMLSALREFALHGEAKFDYWCDQLSDMKSTIYPNLIPHGDFPTNFKLTYNKTLKLKYQF